MRVLVLLLLLVAILATVYASESSCAHKCFAEADKLEGVERKDALEQCRKTCLPLHKPKKDHDERKRVNHPHGKPKKFAKPKRHRPDRVKPKKNETASASDDLILSDNFDQVEEMSEALLNRGAPLEATTVLNVRAEPCTNQRIVGRLAAGQRTTYTGRVHAGCGYTWYSIPNGWVAAKFVREVTNGGGDHSAGGCRTRRYPLFKQCDGRWANNALGRYTICQVGCLMSSVSMALNGLGKRLNGQSPNPQTFNAYLRSHGGYYAGSEFIWGSVARFGLRYQGQPTDKGTINRNICANNVVVLNVNNGGHWVLATGVSANGQTYYVNDPGFNRATYSAGEVVRAGIFSL